MRRVVPVVAAVIALLLGALAALPYWFGIQAESAYQTLAQEISKDGDASITTTRYERGWLGSTAESTLAVAGLPISFTMVHDISHGPLPMGGDLQMQPVLARINSRITASGSLPGLGAAKLPPMTARTVIHTSGNADVHIEIPAIKQAGADGGATIDWRGMTGDIAVSADSKHVKADLAAPAMELSDASGSLTLGRITIGLDQTEGASGLETGTFALAIEKLSTTGPGGKTELDGLRVSSSSREAAGSVTATVSMQFRQVSAGDSSHGPGQLGLQFRNLDAATLAKFQKELGSLKKQKLPQEQLGMMVVGKTLELVGNLAKKAPEMEITKLSLNTKDGELTGKGKVVVDGSKLDTAENPMLLLKAISGEAEVFVPASIVQMLSEKEIHKDLENAKQLGLLTPNEVERLTPKKVSLITQQALPRYMDSVATNMRLVPDGNNFKITATIHQGQLLVNGEPFQQSLRIY